MASQRFAVANQHHQAASSGYNLFILVAILWLLGLLSTFTMLFGYFLTSGLLFRSPLLSSLEMIFTSPNAQSDDGSDPDLSSQSVSDNSGSTTPCPSASGVNFTHLCDDCYHKTDLDFPSVEHVEELIPEASESSVLSGEVPESNEESGPSSLPVEYQDQSANSVAGFRTIFGEYCDQPDTIAEYSSQWEIIAEFEREIWGNVVLAIANNGLHYWRKGNKVRAVSPEQVSGLEQWLQVAQPEPAWLHPEYDAEYITESSDEEEDVETLQEEDAEVLQEEAPVTQLVMSTQLETIVEDSEENDSDLEDMDSEDEALYTEDNQDSDSEDEAEDKKPHPLPLTGHWYPGWEKCSGVDSYGHVYLTQMASQEYWKARGLYRAAKCTWAVQETPSIRHIIESGRKVRSEGITIPKLTMTTPEGVTGYLVDTTQYKDQFCLPSPNGLPSLDDIVEMDSDEEPERIIVSIPATILSPVPTRQHRLTRCKGSFYSP
ncbi:hypothetical protein V8F33_012805 [Rhypophila sp. PSN 637]